MKRTKPSPAQPNRRKLPDSLPDGRILGQKAEDFVPKHLRDKIPSAPDPKTRGRKRRQTHSINMMCRTRMPLFLTPDGEVIIEGHKQIRMKGLNQAKFNAILAGIESGMRINEAARLVGLRPDTIYAWLKRADKGEHPYTIIAGALKEAEARLEQQLLASIRDQGILRLEYDETTTEETTNEHGEVTTKTKTVTKTRWPQYMAAAWILERTRPEAYRSDRDINQTEQPDIAAEIEAMQAISDIRVNMVESEK